MSASKVQVHAGMTPCKTVHLFASWSLGHRIGEVEKFLFWKYACLLPSQDRGGNIDTLVITVCYIKCNTQQLSSLTNIGNTGETSTSSRVTLLSGSPKRIISFCLSAKLEPAAVAETFLKLKQISDLRRNHFSEQKNEHVGNSIQQVQRNSVFIA